MSHAIVAAASAKASALTVVPFRVRLLFVRHGESQMNTSAHLLGGQHNHVPLTQKGVNQSTLLGRRLAFDGTRFDHVYTSTAVRAVTTAEIALKNGGASVASPSMKVDHNSALLEQDQGDWEGMERKDVYTAQVHKEMLDLHMDFKAPGGESLRDVQERAIAYMNGELERWKERSMSDKREIVLGVFAHGGCIRAMLQHFIGVHDQFTWLVAQDNTAISELLIDVRGTALIRLNDTAHLKYTMQKPELLA